MSDFLKYSMTWLRGFFATAELLISYQLVISSDLFRALKLWRHHYDIIIISSSHDIKTTVALFCLSSSRSTARSILCSRQTGVPMQLPAPTCGTTFHSTSMSRSVTRDIGVTDIGLRWEKSVGGVFVGTWVTRALSRSHSRSSDSVSRLSSSLVPTRTSWYDLLIIIVYYHCFFLFFWHFPWTLQ